MIDENPIEFETLKSQLAGGRLSYFFHVHGA